MEKAAEQPSCGYSSYTYQVSRHSAEMLHNLNAQRKDGGRFCDVVLRVGEESFPAHRAVLAACSDYFESVFSCQAAEGGGGDLGGGDRDAAAANSNNNNNRELEMHTISPKVFRDILDFAYTSRIVVRLECFPELMTAAKFLLMRSVIEICQEVIKQSNVQILVPTARGGDASLFQAAIGSLSEPPGFQQQQQHHHGDHVMVNGTGSMLLNGMPSSSFANNGQTTHHVMDGSQNNNNGDDMLLGDDDDESSMPVLQPVDGLPLPGDEEEDEDMNNSFHDSGGGGGSSIGGSPPGSHKRGRGRPKKGTPTTAMEPLHFNHHQHRHGHATSTPIKADVNALFPCRTCGKAFTEPQRLKNHEAQHGAATHNSLVPTEGHGITLISHSHSEADLQGLENGVPLLHGLDHNVNRNKRERTRRHVGCDICGKVFRDVYHLNRHKLSHSGEKPYACHVCGLRFKRKDRMSYHVRSHDGSVGKPYVCQSCGKGFSRPDHLNGHIKQVHTTERPHKCQICNASFATRDRLRSHLACHEDKIPCKICGKFLRAAYMTDHLKKHSEGNHNYCGICNKDGQENAGKCPHLESEESDPSFGELSNGSELKSPHKPDGEELEMSSLACNGPSAGALASPEGSKAKTDPEKKFTCGICGQAFRTKSYLNKHQHRVHKTQKGQGGAGSSGLGELAPTLSSPFSPQQNMSLLESFGFQIVQSAFAASLVDPEAGQSGMDFGGK